MNTPDDDRAVATLQRLAASAAPGHGWWPDAAAVTRRGRRLRLRRRVAATATGGLVVALAIGTPAALADQLRPAPEAAAAPASPDGTPSPTPLPSEWAAPPVAVLAPGVTAATGLPRHAAGQTDAEGDPADWWYQLGFWDGLALTLHVSAADGGTFAVYGTRDGVDAAASDGGAGRLDIELPVAVTLFDDPRDGVFESGVTPSGAVRAFYVTTGGFDAADGTRRYALELPTFVPPNPARGPLEPDQRMYAVAFTAPATDRLLDMTSGVVYTTADGAVVDPDCGSAACTQAQFPEAYDEITALIAAP